MVSRLSNYYDQEFRNDSSSAYGGDQNILTIAHIIILGIAIGTMDVDRDMQATVVNRALRTKPPGGRQPPKYLPVILKEDIVRKEEMQRNHFPG